MWHKFYKFQNCDNKYKIITNQLQITNKWSWSGVDVLIMGATTHLIKYIMNTRYIVN